MIENPRGCVVDSGTQQSKWPPDAPKVAKIQNFVARGIHNQYSHFRAYFTTNVWVPSLALALLHFSALSYAATFLTYLLNAGFSLFLITVARACGSVIEVSSTFIAPPGIRVLARTKALVHDDEGRQELLPGEDLHALENIHAVGLARSGLWGITMQCTCLVCARIMKSRLSY